MCSLIRRVVRLRHAIRARCSRLLKPPRTLSDFLSFWVREAPLISLMIPPMSPVNLKDKMVFLLNIGDAKNSLAAPNLPCNTVYDGDFDVYGYPVDKTRECGCSSCESNCTPVDWSQIVKPSSIFEGITLSGIYLMIFFILISLSANLFNYLNKKKIRSKRSDSFDSYERIKFDLIK